ncbi:Multidrug resistance transporter, Bcr/CflA family [Cronobacter condimenti 1330]|uniref:Bcr/CflA family efflux transporter n=2 Tax=Cronobacter condimenti TaxID=1163710 RepID=K7ZZK5_9ENTR|nr:multidrug transporter CflA [Cronobacter condimenti 1330]CCJ72283.1 Multidrug resistance transporter, Bcr/CflA family [Cronobacter condimenti 1330]
MNKYRFSRNGSLSLSLILLLALLTALDAMAIDMYLPGMPDIAAEFGVPAGRIQQTLSIFLAGLAIGQGIYGPLLDRYGRRVPLLAGAVIFTAGSVLGAVAPSVEWLLFARFVQAIGAAAGLVAPRAIVADICTLTESARIFSLLMQVMMIAPILAPVLGGYLLGHGGWRFIFWMLAAFGAAGFVWGCRTITDTLPAHKRARLNPGAIMRAYSLQLRNTVFMAYTVSGGFILSSLFVYISSSAFIFTRHFNVSPAQFSYIFAANSVGLVMGGMLSNRLASKGLSSSKILTAGLIIHTLAALGLFVIARSEIGGMVAYGGVLAIIIGSLGLVFGNVTALTMNNAGPQAGTASALMGMLQYFIAAVVGYIATFFVQSPALMPAVITLCGALAVLFQRLATRVSLKPGTLQERNKTL